MFKNSYSIQQKWDKKVEEMKKKADLKYSVLLEKKRIKCDKLFDYEAEKIKKKKLSYIRKKEEEYRRKMNNEIRELEGKPKREYKTPPPKIKPIQFAMEIAQENARLRDSDADGNGYCISCNGYCSWGNHAGGHRYSRKFTDLCLEKENINLQCHNCNNITGPLGNTKLKEQTNMRYDENLDKKFGKGTAARLKRKVANYFQGKTHEYDLTKKIPQLIKLNEELWKTKNFYAPRKKWGATWTKYCNRT